MAAIVPLAIVGTGDLNVKQRLWVKPVLPGPPQGKATRVSSLRRASLSTRIGHPATAAKRTSRPKKTKAGLQPAVHSQNNFRSARFTGLSHSQPGNLFPCGRGKAFFIWTRLPLRIGGGIWPASAISLRNRAGEQNARSTPRSREKHTRGVPPPPPRPCLHHLPHRRGHPWPPCRLTAPAGQLPRWRGAWRHTQLLFSHRLTCSGCIVSSTTAMSCVLRRSRFTSSRAATANPASVRAASYLLR